MHPSTKENLMRAMEREAVSAARLTAYAAAAERNKNGAAARTLRALARLDLQHAAEMIDVLGWVGPLRDNVLASVVGDATAHGLSYATRAYEARKAGDSEAAELFRRLTTDESEAALVLLSLMGGDQVIGSSDEGRARDSDPSPSTAWSPTAA